MNPRVLFSINQKELDVDYIQLTYELSMGKYETINSEKNLCIKYLHKEERIKLYYNSIFFHIFSGELNRANCQ